MVIRRLFDRLTGAHYCPICFARLPKRAPLTTHWRVDHYQAEVDEFLEDGAGGWAV